jgi:two-component system response regulator HydG
LGQPEDLQFTPTQVPQTVTPVASAQDSAMIGRTMEEIERWAIEETLKLTGGNRKRASEILKIGERTLYRKLDNQQLE